ncbi:MAG: hypothetical protein KF689_03870 [Gemmatimonadaceae bacterium]|nr:hypothetical protein [Gemmatimonadaceae bacterium]MCW5825681.1 hypothetical protein [Gemmatimonadaceae bacterium]
MTPRSVRLVLVGFAVIAASCAESSDLIPPPVLDVVEGGPVRAEVLEELALPGEAVDVRFVNSSGTEYWFNPCERTVERLVDGVWVSLGQEMRLCTAVAYLLMPNGRRTDPVDVPGDLGPGTYRFRFELRPPSTTDVRARPASSTFEVQ